jgi:hypothetical protein
MAVDLIRLGAVPAGDAWRRRQRSARTKSSRYRLSRLERVRVRVAEDFPDLDELRAVDREGVPPLTAGERDQELHLLYVAATRARRGLEPNGAVRGCLAAAGEGPAGGARPAGQPRGGGRPPEGAVVTPASAAGLRQRRTLPFHTGGLPGDQLT